MALVMPRLAIAADDPVVAAEALLREIAAPVFEAADIAPELQVPVKLIRDDVPTAAIYGQDHARISSALFLMASTPEELAAVIARLIASQKIDMAGSSTDKRFRIRAKVPSQSVLRGSITSVDEAMAAPGIEAARDTLNRRGPAGPSVEEIRSRAQRMDGEAIGILRVAGLSGESLLSLYRRMVRDGAGLFERNDYEGRRILAEQIPWLNERVDPAETRPDLWQALDARLSQIQQDLRQE